MKSRRNASPVPLRRTLAKGLVLLPFLAACGEVDDPTLGTTEAEIIAGPRRLTPLSLRREVADQRLVFRRWLETCTDGEPRFTRLGAAADADGRSVAFELHGRDCGADLGALTYETFDAAGTLLYLRGPSVQVGSIETDERGWFVVRGRATSSCGTVLGGETLVLRHGEAAISVDMPEPPAP